jgi:lathosterol oxidase
MDVILEVADSFIFDHFYSWAFPAHQAPLDFPGDFASNATTALTSWQYKPSTTWFPIPVTDAAYNTAVPRDNLVRQGISFFFILWLFGALVYFIFATLSYIFVFDKETFKHPKYLKNQIRLEMIQANWAFPGMALMTVPICVAEVNGWSKLYDTSADGPGRWWDIMQFPAFIVFTDFCIYLIHRGLHHPMIYKRFHKPHHKWIVPTPFASHAFHPVDGYLQGLPYHIFPFLFPLNKIAYIGLFVLVNFWTIMIHDGEYIANNPIVNGAACHAIHHIAFNYNYGQYTTFWDRVGNSYRAPDEELFKKEQKKSQTFWKKQAKQMEEIGAEVEGEDDRVYADEEETKKTI